MTEAAKTFMRVPRGLPNPQKFLTDGRGDPPLKPWMSWTTVSVVDSGRVSKIPWKWKPRIRP